MNRKTSSLSWHKKLGYNSRKSQKLVHSGCFSKEQGSLKKQTKKPQNILLANIIDLFLYQPQYLNASHTMYPHKHSIMSLQKSK